MEHCNTHVYPAQFAKSKWLKFKEYICLLVSLDLEQQQTKQTNKQTEILFDQYNPANPNVLYKLKKSKVLEYPTISSTYCVSVWAIL